MVHETEQFKKNLYLEENKNKLNQQYASFNNKLAASSSSSSSTSGGSKAGKNAVTEGKVLPPPPGLENFVAMPKPITKTAVKKSMSLFNAASNHAILNTNGSFEKINRNVGPIQRPTSTSTYTNISNNTSSLWPTTGFNEPDFSHLGLDNQSKKLTSFDDGVFSEFKLFGNNLTGGSQKRLSKTSSSGLAGASSLWGNNNETKPTANGNVSKAWNSVLLNDFDHFSPPASSASFINHLDQSTNDIKNIWSNNTLEHVSTNHQKDRNKKP